MKIAFDSQIFSLQKYGGISRYICNLATHLARTSGVEAKIFSPFYINAYIRDLPKEIVSGVPVPKIPKMGSIFHQSGLLLARQAIARFSPQVVHETYYAGRSSAPKGTRTVITVYDMIHEYFPAMFAQTDPTSRLKRAAVLRADQIICISENTRRNLLELIPVSPDKVSVVHLGFDKFSSLTKEVPLELQHVEIPYLLYVGSRNGHKNFQGFLKAYASSAWLKQNFRIISIGASKLQSDELELINRLGIKSWQLVQLDADDNMLAEYYRNAAAFVYPSYFEGFGIPPLEAMSLDCPVICSNSSSIPEVVGSAGEYFDPHSVDSIRDAIEHVLQDSSRRKFLIEEGAKRCAHFSWERCASETLKIYQGLI